MSVCTKIQERYDELSKAQRKVADYIAEHLEFAAMKTTVKISQAAGVSETTVIRLAYSLGYDSFSAFQNQIQEDVLDNNRSRHIENQGEQNEYQKLLSREATRLLDLRDRMADLGQLRDLAARIAAADHVMVFGYYGEHTAAYQLFFMLDTIRPNVYYYRENNVGFREMAELNPRSVVIAVSFRPYAPGTLELVQQSKSKGPYLIAITDSILSPVGQLSDEVVTVSLERDPETGINSMAPVLAYCQMLIMAVKDANREEALYRVKNVQSQLVQPGALTLHNRE